jgi:hypothetical protein
MLKFSKRGISVSAVLDRRRMKISGMYPVKVEVVCRRRQKYFPTGVDMLEDDWERLWKRRKMTPEMIEIEECFNRVRNEVAEMLDKDVFSLRALEARCGKGACFNVNNAFQIEMERCRSDGRVNSYYRFRSALINIERYGGVNIQPAG